MRDRARKVEEFAVFKVKKLSNLSRAKDLPANKGFTAMQVNGNARIESEPGWTEVHRGGWRAVLVFVSSGHLFDPVVVFRSIRSV